MEVRNDQRLQETMVSATLPAGLRVVVFPRPGWQEVTCRIAVNYGSVDSQFTPDGRPEPVMVPDGIAHFLEHKLFEKTWGNAFDKFAKLGAECNAYTSYHQTVYYFNATEHVPQCLDVLLDLVHNPYFTDASVAKEQGIIAQEIRMYLDNAEWRLRQNLLTALYHHHPVRVDIAGTVDSIQKITKEDLYMCHRTFYHPSNMLVFVTGDVDPDATIQHIAKDLAARGYGPQPPIGRVCPEEPQSPAQKRVSEHMAVAQPLLRLAYKGRPLQRTGRDLLEREILMSIILDVIIGRASSLYNELYETGLIDARFGADHTEEPDYAYTIFSGPTRDPDELERQLRDGIQALQARGLSEGDFLRAKRKTQGRFLSYLNSLGSIAYIMTDGVFKDIHLFDILPAAEALKLDDANRLLQQQMEPDLAAASIVWPRTKTLV